MNALWEAYWDSWWPQATGIALLAFMLHLGGGPFPQVITVACWPFILWNLGRAAWNLR